MKNLIEKYKLKKSQALKAYISTKKENYKHRGCCMEADARARMDEINEIYTDLLALSKSLN